jgi:hypothetical protein
MLNEPYFEDIMKYYFHYSFKQLFPKKGNNLLIVYIIGIFHLLGGLLIHYGPFILSPNNLILYILFLIMNLFGYYIFNNNCFMTLLSNYYSKNKEYPNTMRWSLFKSIIVFNLIISIIGVIFPKYAPITWYSNFIHL